MKKWTYGIEAEMIDFNNQNPITGKYYISSEVCSINSDGIACSWQHNFGGEVNTYPTDSIEEQEQIFKIFLKDNPSAKANYRTTLHTHVHIPGLTEDLEKLKTILQYSIQWTPWIMKRIYVLKNTPEFQEYDKRKVLWRFLHVGTVMPPEWRINQIMKANTVEEFFNNHMLSKAGKFTPLQAKRYAVNLLKLKQTGTIEFRHFHGPENEKHVRSALELSRSFLECALQGVPFDEVWYHKEKEWELPPPQPLDVELEKRYHETKIKNLGRSTPKYVLNGIKVGSGSSTINKKRNR